MIVLESKLLKKYPQIIFGFSTKKGAGRKKPYFFNISFSVGDDKKIVEENREKFYKHLGLNPDRVAYQKQVHGDTINFVEKSGFAGESDALITNKKNLGLAITTADCTPIFIYDKTNKIIVAVHSGWRGTEKKILKKTINKLVKDFNSSVNDLIVYIGPSICQKHYEVGEDVAKLFDEKYLIRNNDKYLLDIPQINFDILIECGIKKENTEYSDLCTYAEKDLLHSYRRDGEKSGRAFGIIAIKE